jgi:RNA polymerase sigma factor (sigma-70 family)
MPLSAEQIAALVDRHAIALQIWLGRKYPQAEDIVQEAFCRLATLSSPPEQTAAWLYRVVRNLAENQRVMGRRRVAREQRVAAAEAVNHDPSEQLVVDEALAAVYQLDDSLREVVTARIWGQLTFEEIGAVCRISAATASRRYHDALAQLRQRMGVSWPKTIPSTIPNSATSNRD